MLTGRSHPALIGLTPPERAGQRMKVKRFPIRDFPGREVTQAVDQRVCPEMVKSTPLHHWNRGLWEKIRPFPLQKIRSLADLNSTAVHWECGDEKDHRRLHPLRKKGRLASCR